MTDDHRIRLYITSYSEEVTGSNNHIKIDWPDGRTASFLVDCGLFQEEEYNKHNIEKFPFNPSNISFAIATHVHTDHVGRFPFLMKEGFNGKIYTSYETYVILPTVLSETCERLQDNYRVELSKYKKRKLSICKKKRCLKGRGRRDKQRKESKKKKFENLKYPELIYEKSDIDDLMKQVEYKPLLKTFEPIHGVEITFYSNAHIAGATITVVRVYDECDEVYVLFTGDLGITNPVTGIYTDVPKDVCERIDIVVSESTYGSSEISRNVERERKRHIEILKDIHSKNGTIMYLSNSLERPLRLGVDLKTMQQDEELKEIMGDFHIYFDSTFGIKCLNKYIKLYGKDYLPQGFTVIDKDSREAVMANEAPKIIICTSPRLYQGSFLAYGNRMLENSHTALIFVAYVPENVKNVINLPLGAEIDFMGEKTKLRCKRYQFGYYSSHVTTSELDNFLVKFTNASTILFNHGCDEAKCNYVDRYKKKGTCTHNMLYSKTIMVTKDGIKKYF